MDVATATVAEIRDWLTERIATFLEISPEDIDATENLAHFGVDSMSMVALGLSIEELFEFEIEPDFFRRCLTIDDVAKVLHDRPHVPPEETGGDAA
jgi:acyl carrier protein